MGNIKFKGYEYKGSFCHGHDSLINRMKATVKYVSTDFVDNYLRNTTATTLSNTFSRKINSEILVHIFIRFFYAFTKSVEEDILYQSLLKKLRKTLFILLHYLYNNISFIL